MKAGAAARGRVRPDFPTMRLDDGPADRQPQTHAFGLRTEEGLEEMGSYLFGKPGPCVGDGDPHHGRALERGRDSKLAYRTVGHRFGRIADQIDKDLLDLDAVGEDGRSCRIERELGLDTALTEAHQAERARFLYQLWQVFDLLLHLAARHEIAQPA